MRAHKVYKTYYQGFQDFTGTLRWKSTILTDSFWLNYIQDSQNCVIFLHGERAPIPKFRFGNLLFDQNSRKMHGDEENWTKREAAHPNVYNVNLALLIYNK